MENQSEADLAKGSLAEEVALLDEGALALRALDHAAGDEFIERAVGGDERDLHLLDEFFGGGHLLAGREDAGVDRLADEVADGEIERSAGLGSDGFQFSHGSHDGPFARTCGSPPAQGVGDDVKSYAYSIIIRANVKPKSRSLLH